MSSLFCPVCGTENPNTRQFCRKCAADLHAPVPDATAPVEPASAPVQIRPIAIGGGIALVVIVLVAIVVVVLGGAGGPSATPAPTATPAATTVPTNPPTVAPTATPESTPAPTPKSTPVASAGSGKPSVESLSGPRTASCTGDNGTGTPGYIHLTWTASNATGIRLSIDPPAPDNAYDYGYEDFGPEGSADVPFTCDPPNTDSNGAYHLYVATTLHDGGRWGYRYTKIYIKN